MNDSHRKIWTSKLKPQLCCQSDKVYQIGMYRPVDHFIKPEEFSPSLSSRVLSFPRLSLLVQYVHSCSNYIFSQGQRPMSTRTVLQIASAASCCRCV